MSSGESRGERTKEQKHKGTKEQINSASTAQLLPYWLLGVPLAD